MSAFASSVQDNSLDALDEMKILAYLTTQSEVLEESDKEMCLLQLRELIQRLETHTHVGLEFQANVASTCKAIREALGPKGVDILDPTHWGGIVPEPLIINNFAGSVPAHHLVTQPEFHLRGKTYLTDGGRKVPASPPLFVLRGVQAVHYSEFRYHIAEQKWSWLPKYRTSNEWLLLNYMIPGPTCVSIICYFTAIPVAVAAVRAPTEGTPATAPHPGLELLRKFWKADQEFCDARFKLVPNVVEGAYVVKMAIGQKPVMVGQKLTQRYFRGPGYFEVDINLSSSSVATSILGIVRGASKNMVVDLGVTLQGETEGELPELLLCQARYDRVDMGIAELVVHSEK